MSVAAFLHGITKRFGGIVGRLKVFRVARYDDQQGIAAVALPCFEEQLGFVCAFVHARAGADDDGACADAFFKGDGKRARVVGGRDVVFGIAADVDVDAPMRCRRSASAAVWAKQPERLCMAGSTSLRI